MKKLFLTSSAYQVLDKFVELLDRSPSELTIALVPTAADTYENKPFVEKDRNKLLELGFKVIDINIVGKNEEELKELFKNIDIIFVAGGNTFYLLEQTRASGFDKIVEEHINQGKWYIGSSAGSILACPSIEYIKLLDNPQDAPNLKSFEALNLIDKMIIPHFDSEKYQDRIKQILEDHPQYQFIRLTDNQAFLVIDEKEEIIEI